MNFSDTQIFASPNAAIISDSPLGRSSKLYMIDMNNEMSIAIPTLPILNNVTQLLRTRHRIFWSEGFIIKAFSLEDLETRIVFSNEGKGKTYAYVLLSEQFIVAQLDGELHHIKRKILILLSATFIVQTQYTIMSPWLKIELIEIAWSPFFSPNSI